MILVRASGLALLCFVLAPPRGSVEPWLEIETADVVLLSEASAGQARRLVSRLEELYGLLPALLESLAILPRLPGFERCAAVDPPAAPLLVVALSAPDTFALLAPGNRPSSAERLGGFTYTSRAGDEIVLRLGAPQERPDAVLVHELTHLMVHSACDEALPPAWLREGLAEVFSTLELGDDRVAVGRAHRRHLATLEREGLLPFAALSSEPLEGSGPGSSRWYATAWALAHSLVLGGSPREGVSAEAWQPPEPERLERYLTTRLPTVTLPRPPSNPSPRRERRLSPAETRAWLGTLLLRRGKASAAIPFLEAALSEEPDLVAALEDLGRAQAAAGHDLAATQTLELGLRRGSASPDLFGLFSATVQRGVRRAFAAGADPAPFVAALERLGDEAEVAPVWIGLAEIAAAYAGPERDDLVVSYCERAVAAAPESAWNRLLLARALLVSSREPEAQAAAAEAARLAVAGNDPVTSNNVCWYGGIGGLAASVGDACEHAVRLAPERGIYRDSRGLVRALLGELAAAAADFRFFLASEDGRDPNLNPGREAWLAHLERGENPFDAATLTALSDLPF